MGVCRMLIFGTPPLKAMNRFNIKQIGDRLWKVTDTLSEVEITWTEGDFNDSQEVRVDGAFAGDPKAIARVLREIGDYLATYYREIL